MNSREEHELWLLRYIEEKGGWEKASRESFVGRHPKDASTLRALWDRVSVVQRAFGDSATASFSEDSLDPAHASALQAGYQVENYRLIKLIGQGGIRYFFSLPRPHIDVLGQMIAAQASGGLQSNKNDANKLGGILSFPGLP